MFGNDGRLKSCADRVIKAVVFCIVICGADCFFSLIVEWVERCIYIEWFGQHLTALTVGSVVVKMTD